MSETTAIVPRTEMTMSDTMALGQTLAKSGYFSDARDAAQAVVKVLAGRELGFGPIASMTGINIIKGNVTLSANLIASAIKRSGVYNYRVRKHTNELCEIEFFEAGASVGVSSFTMDDAKTAGLQGDNWRKFPRNMLFARAISNGAKWYCPDIFGGPVYTPDELGAITDGETGEVIDVTPTPQPAPDNGRAPHWIENPTVRARFWAWTKADLALTEAQVHEAMAVEHIADFGGTMQEAKDKILAWIDARANIEQAVAELYDDQEGTP